MAAGGLPGSRTCCAVAATEESTGRALRPNRQSAQLRAFPRVPKSAFSVRPTNKNKNKNLFLMNKENACCIHVKIQLSVALVRPVGESLRRGVAPSCIARCSEIRRVQPRPAV